MSSTSRVILYSPKSKKCGIQLLYVLMSKSFLSYYDTSFEIEFSNNKTKQNLINHISNKQKNKL